MGLGSLLIFVLLVAGALNGGWFVSWAWPQVFSIAGLVLIWRNAPEEEQATLRHLLEPLGAATGDVTYEGSWRRRGTVAPPGPRGRRCWPAGWAGCSRPTPAWRCCARSAGCCW